MSEDAQNVPPEFVLVLAKVLHVAHQLETDSRRTLLRPLRIIYKLFQTLHIMAGAVQPLCCYQEVWCRSYTFDKDQKAGDAFTEIYHASTIEEDNEKDKCRK